MFLGLFIFQFNSKPFHVVISFVSIIRIHHRRALFLYEKKMQTDPYALEPEEKNREWGRGWCNDENSLKNKTKLFQSIFFQLYIYYNTFYWWGGKTLNNLNNFILDFFHKTLHEKCFEEPNHRSNQIKVHFISFLRAAI